MIENKIADILDWPDLPLIWTRDSSRRSVRLLGLTMMIVWFIPALFISLMAIGFLNGIELFFGAWDGDQ